MKHRPASRRLPAALLVLLLWPLSGCQSSVLEVGSRKQFFIDDHLIESSQGISRRLQQPTKHPQNPVLAGMPKDDPLWESDMDIYFPSVIFDREAGLFKMWYGLWERNRRDEDSVLAYATSQDGLSWEKPGLGLFSYRGTRRNNLVMDHNGLCCGVFKDFQEDDPAKRYKMLFMCSDSYKVCAAYSEDGLHWKRYQGGLPVISQFPDGFFADSHMVAYWDPGLSRYVAILRQRTYSGKSRHKTPAQAESRDFVNWTPPRPLLRAEEADGRYRQFYNMEVMLYEGIRLGFTTVFAHGSREDQPFDRGSIQLTYSRDGRRWERWKGRVFLPVSEQPGDFDWGMVYMAQAPVVVGDEIYLYYAGHGHDHRHHLPPGVRQLKGGVGLAKLRLDGFVAVEPTVPEEQGSLTTKPFRIWGEKLQINASAPEGPLTVEILDGASRPIPGFSRQDCDPFSGDRVRHTVTWQGQAGLQALKGKTVRLQFYLVRARLYAFQFQ